MEVANYIREYLYKQDYLDVQGLGTFFLSRDPFSLDNPQQKLKPSVKVLVFRENSRINSDSLVHFIARRKQIQLEDAKSLVNNFTNEIKTLIGRKGSIDILGFGKFYSEDGANLEFKSHPNNYSALSFGLGELNLPLPEKKTETLFPTDKSPAFSDYKPFGTSLTGESKTGPTLNEFFSANKSNNDLNLKEPKMEPHIPVFEDLDHPDKPDLIQEDKEIHHEIHEEPPISFLEEENTHKDEIKEPEISHSESINHPMDSSASLPTAEDLYRVYSFKKEDSGQDQNVHSEEVHPIEKYPTEVHHSEEHPMEENHDPINEEPKEEIPTSWPDHHHEYTSEKLEEINPFPTESEHENIEESKPFSWHHEENTIKDPLSYSESDFKSFSETKAEETSHESEHLVPVETEESNLEQIKPKRNIWVWVLSALILLTTLAGLTYSERGKIEKKFGIKLFPNDSKLDNQANEIHKKHVLDSLEKQRQNFQDSLKSVSSIDSSKLLKEIPNTIKDSVSKNTKKDTSSVVKPISSGIASKDIKHLTNKFKEIEESMPFLIVAYASHITPSSVALSKKLTKNNIENSIIHLSHGGQLIHYQVILGEYQTRDLAEKGLNELLQNQNFISVKKSSDLNPYIFENKSVKP